MTIVDWLYRLDGAIKLQNYRSIALETLSESGSISLGGAIPGELDKAMDGIQDANDWAAVGQQLALLKRRADFRAVYIRADNQVAKLVVVCQMPGSPTRASDYRPTFEFAWEDAKSLEPHLKNYKLSPEFLALIAALVQKYGGQNADPIQKALNWLLVATQIHASGGGPNAAFVGVCAAGLDGDLKGRLAKILFGSDFQKKEMWGFDFHPPTMQGMAWDLGSNQLFGHAEFALSKDALAHGLG
jgi:hypothetical protein